MSGLCNFMNKLINKNNNNSRKTSINKRKLMSSIQTKYQKKNLHKFLEEELVKFKEVPPIHQLI